MGFDEKVRLRSEEELDLQFQGLVRVSIVMSRVLDRWFLGTGTLLGAVREGDFIKWDWDVCIDVLTEEARPKQGELCDQLEGEGFQITKVDSTIKNFKVVASGYGTDYEILGRYLKRGNIRARLMLEVPAKFYEKQECVKIRGQSFPAPSPAEEYLEALYGDWRTPKRTADKSEYFSPAAFVDRGNKKLPQPWYRIIRGAKNLILSLKPRRKKRFEK